MTILRGHVFGHPCQLIDDGTGREWHWSDTGEPVPPFGITDRACPSCKQKQTPEGHDPCLGTLPGVAFACCGHGVSEGYVAFTNGIVLRGRFNVERD